MPTRSPAVRAWVVCAVYLLVFFPYIAAHSQGCDACASETGTIAPFAGVGLRVQNATIPPGGMFQYQLALTEAKPISSGSTSPTVPTGTVGPVRGIALGDPLGKTVGVAVVSDSGIQFAISSPTSSFGAGATDYPIIAIAMPVRTDAVSGSQFPIGIDALNTLWTDPFGQPYPMEIFPERLTIGGSFAISDVVPGGGFQPAGTRISIFGVGFTPLSQVDISGVTLTTSDYQVISPEQIDVVLPQGVQMGGARVRVKSKGATVTYFSYLRTQSLGQSSHLLVAQSYPLFARRTLTSASLPWTRSGTTFTALAVQNPGNVSADITVEMRSATGLALGTFSFPLPPLTRITRDLLEFFAAPPDAAVSLQIASSVPVQMLGLLGDDAANTVVPVIVSAP